MAPMDVPMIIIHCLASRESAWVGLEVGPGVVGIGVGLGLGAGVGADVGAAVGSDVGAGVGNGVGAGVGGIEQHPHASAPQPWLSKVPPSAWQLASDVTHTPSCKAHAF